MSHSLFSQNPWYSADIIRGYKPDFTPCVAFILDSNLGALADQIEDAIAISYEKSPGLPVSTIYGHVGELVSEDLMEVPVTYMRGRGHFYEGRGMTVTANAIHTLKLLGCELLFCTNAVGSLRPEARLGSLVVLSDHVNTMPSTPMIKPNDERFGERFFSLTNAYDTNYHAVLQTVTAEEGSSLGEGVFVSCPRPNFETTVEIRVMQIIGGDVVRMLMVSEVIFVRHCDLKVITVVTIISLVEGLDSAGLSHAQTLAAVGLSRQNLISLICGFLRKLA